MDTPLQTSGAPTVSSAPQQNQSDVTRNFNGLQINSDNSITSSGPTSLSSQGATVTVTVTRQDPSTVYPLTLRPRPRVQW